MTFNEKLTSSLDSKNSHVCVGLDSRYDRIPDFIKKNNSISDGIYEFNRQIIEATNDFAAVYKSNIAFYAGFGEEGLQGLVKTNLYLQKNYPEIPLLADCKRSEMGESVKMIKQEIYDWLGFDCVMVTPWFGFDTVRDYLDDEKNGVAVYVHDSNPTAVEFQELELKDGTQLYEYVTRRVCEVWNTNGNVFLEAGATYPDALKKVREIAGEEMVILTAGVGTQGGTLEDIKGTFGKNGKRMLVNSSRGIIFAGEGKKEYFEAVRDAAELLRVQLEKVSVINA
ncbi:MAG: orotidine-5'-phosphate decarboxylase [Patescibacteria group bacterium]